MKNDTFRGGQGALQPLPSTKRYWPAKGRLKWSLSTEAYGSEIDDGKSFWAFDDGFFGKSVVIEEVLAVLRVLTNEILFQSHFLVVGES